MPVRQTAPPQRPPVNFSGFTLLELLFTLALFSIILTAGVPMLTDTVARYKAESNLRNFRSLVSFARAEAIVRKTDVVLCPKVLNSLSCHSSGIADSDEESAVWSRGWLLFVDRGKTPTSIDEDDGDVLLKTFDEIGQNVEVIMGGSTGGSVLKYIRFMSRGNSYPTNPSALFCVRNDDGVIFGGKVVIMRGRTRMEDSATAKQECAA
ncbi:GspH/FimT family protein [Sansalvadorimonas sp. 2012CJ34-2]|uniref:Type II secretion system protein H n=1 Tax=Parendozoicomonas callyspongiae TaxID=2942213 RepID=A0ABT0PDT5_9GAMM|nr:GspH/FimT family protein [Sansalvadorimonas sp. 2012CJ34-2]MCL6269483.1 GspH/FimT family protein [Sansalvadorimonas sp. 2012CJ34-2]